MQLDVHTLMRSGLQTGICVALFTLAARGLCAQDISLGGRLGGVAGIAWFDDDESNDVVKPYFGPQIGAAAGYRWASKLSLRAELWYVRKGWTETPAGGARRLSYLELPLFLQVTAPWWAAPHLLAGASASLEVGCSVTGVPEAGSVSCDDPRVEWKRPKAQLGAWAGLGVRKRLGANHVDVQLLGNLNLTNLNREPLPRDRGRLISLIASVAYMIPVGGT